MDTPNLATLISKFGFSRAVFVCGIGLLVLHIVTFEQLVIILLLGLGTDRVAIAPVNFKRTYKK